MLIQLKNRIQSKKARIAMIGSNSFKLILLSFNLSLIFFLSAFQAQGAVDYQEFAIEQRMNEVKREAVKTDSQQIPQELKDSFEKEKELLRQQMTIITGDEDTRNIIVSGDTLQVAYKDQG